MRRSRAAGAFCYFLRGPSFVENFGRARLNRRGEPPLRRGSSLGDVFHRQARAAAIRRHGTADGRLPAQGQPVRRLRGAPLGRQSRHPAMRRLWGISQARGHAPFQRPASGRMLGPLAPPVLRPPHHRRVGRRNGHGRADEAAVGRRGRSAMSAAAGAPGGGATGDVGRYGANAVRPLGERIAAHRRQTETGRGDPICKIPTRGLATLPRRRPR